MELEIGEDTKIADLIESYPFVAEYLLEEYGFHCVNCIFANFDTLKLGAEIHGIDGEDLVEMIENIKNYINSFINSDLVD